MPICVYFVFVSVAQECAAWIGGELVELRTRNAEMVVAGGKRHAQGVARSE